MNAAMNASMIEQIEIIINSSKNRFNSWLEIYSPWQGPNHTTERNLSFQFATAFLSLYSEGLAFMEIPFAATPGGNNCYHLDAYLHAEKFDLLLECKNVYAPSHIPSITADINRMNPFLISQIHNRHRISKPNSTYGVILVETWHPNIAMWWKNREDPTVKNNWREMEEKLPSGWKYDYIKVHEHSKEKDGTLFWLYGISENTLGKVE